MNSGRLSDPVGQTSTSRGALVLVCPTGTGLDKRPTIGLLVVVHASRAPTVHNGTTSYGTQKLICIGLLPGTYCSTLPLINLSREKPDIAYRTGTSTGSLGPGAPKNESHLVNDRHHLDPQNTTMGKANGTASMAQKCYPSPNTVA
jgi:hypothetical protein